MWKRTLVANMLQRSKLRTRREVENKSAFKTLWFFSSKGWFIMVFWKNSRCYKRSSWKWLVSSNNLKRQYELVYIFDHRRFTFSTIKKSYLLTKGNQFHFECFSKELQFHLKSILKRTSSKTTDNVSSYFIWILVWFYLCFVLLEEKQFPPFLVGLLLSRFKAYKLFETRLRTNIRNKPMQIQTNTTSFRRDH